jgi:hypothetical protein
MAISPSAFTAKGLRRDGCEPAEEIFTDAGASARSGGTDLLNVLFPVGAHLELRAGPSAVTAQFATLPISPVSLAQFRNCEELRAPPAGDRGGVPGASGASGTHERKKSFVAIERDTPHNLERRRVFCAPMRGVRERRLVFIDESFCTIHEMLVVRSAIGRQAQDLRRAGGWAVCEERRSFIGRFESLERASSGLGVVVPLALLLV